MPAVDRAVKGIGLCAGKDGGEPPAVVLVRVRADDGVQMVNLQLFETRNQLLVVFDLAAVNEQGLIAAEQQRAVSLPDVQKMDLQLRSICLRRFRR